MIALVLLAQMAAAAPAPAVKLERILDGRGRAVAAQASVTVEDERSRVVVRLVRGLGADDLVQREVYVKDPSGQAPPIRTREVWLADRAALRFADLPDGRIETGEGEDAFRFFEADRATRTVRCNLSAIAETLDARLVPAAFEYGRLKEELGDSAWSDAELPLALLRSLSPPRPPAPATHRREPMPADDPAAESLTAAARAAAARR